MLLQLSGLEAATNIEAWIGQSSGCSAISYTRVPTMEQSTATNRESAVQDTDWPDFFRFTGTATCGCGDAAGVLAVASVPRNIDPEILRRVTGDQGQPLPIGI